MWKLFEDYSPTKKGLTVQTSKSIFSTKTQALPHLGVGMSLPVSQLQHVNHHWPQVDFFEIISEEFIYSESGTRKRLQALAERYPITMHGVSLSIGNIGPLNIDYLSRIKQLADETKAAWVSDHLCWTGILGHHGEHELLPIMLNEKTLKHVANRIRIIQDFLERPLVIENASVSLGKRHSSISEADFLRYLTEETGCGLLLDVDNVWKSCCTKDIDPLDYIADLPHDKIVQIHIANDQSFDAEDYESLEFIQAWDLLQDVWSRTGGVTTMLEWENEKMDMTQYLLQTIALKEDIQTMDRLWMSPSLSDDEYDAISVSLQEFLN